LIRVEEIVESLTSKKHETRSHIASLSSCINAQFIHPERQNFFRQTPSERERKRQKRKEENLFAYGTVFGFEIRHVSVFNDVFSRVLFVPERAFLADS
jgi:hypothetical protein